MMRECLRLIAIPLLAVAGVAVAADGVPTGEARSATADLVVDGGPFHGAAGADLSLIPLAAIVSF